MVSRICKNKITDQIRELFNANPVKVPEERIRPLCILEIEKNRAQFLGDFKFLVQGGFTHDLEIKESDVSEVSDQRSKTIDFKLGFGILGTFIKAFGAEPAGVSAALSKTKKMAFSFSNVKRHHFDILQFGMILSQNNLVGDPNNFIVSEILKNKKLKLGLITDVLVSNNFTLSSFTESEAAAEIDASVIEGILANAKAGLKIERTNENEIKFEQENPLTFAFSCIEIEIDENTGKFSRGDWIKKLKAAKGMDDINESDITNEDLEKHGKWTIDENLANPLMWEM